jgi:hypothetical protein
MTSLETGFWSLAIMTWLTPDSMTPFKRCLCARPLAVDGALGSVIWIGECLFHHNCISATNFATVGAEGAVTVGLAYISSGILGRLLDLQKITSHLVIPFYVLVKH